MLSQEAYVADDFSDDLIAGTEDSNEADVGLAETSLHLIPETDGDFSLALSVTPEGSKRAKFRDSEFEPPSFKPTIARFHARARKLVFFPTVTSATSSRFLSQKYSVRTITLENQDGVPFMENAPGHIEGLPAGFIHDGHQGFGLLPKNRLIMSVIGRVEGITDLTLTDDRLPIAVAGSSLRMSYSDFDRLRRAIQRSHAAAVRFANAGKEAYLYNEIVSPLDPDKYPLKLQPYEKDALQKASLRALSAPGTVSKSDQRAAVQIVKTEVRRIAERDKSELLELSREIEVVSLEVVIEKMTTMVKANLDELSWQQFLSANPFILRLAFGLPVMVLGEQVSVGGVRFENVGGKLADFVVTTGAYGNLAIIEIKKPSTILVEPSPYRLGLHAPTKELAGSVNQVIDQRYMLTREIDVKKANSLRPDVWTYAVKCYVIAGKTIAEADPFSQAAKRKSFEFYRHSLVDVTVITFDELLEKLTALLVFLKPPEGANWAGQ